MKIETEEFENLRTTISKEKRMIAEISSLGNYMKNADVGEQTIIDAQIDMIQQTIRRANEEIPPILEKINADNMPSQNIFPKMGFAELTPAAANAPRATVPIKSMPEPVKVNTISHEEEKRYTLKDLKPVGLERVTLKRIKKKDKIVEAIKEKEASAYVMFANKFFSKTADKVLNQIQDDQLERDLIKANLQFTPKSYFSVILLTTCISLVAGLLIGIFFFFFNITSELPIIVKTTTSMGARLLKLILITALTPILIFLFMYFYPGMEKGSTERRIEEELPFATIHMSAISGSMIDPSKIFNIILSTHEYPYIEREFRKLINEINLYGYDLVSALRTSAYNTPSRKLSELFNGLATTINSGGYLPEFFDKRSQTLLFENRLEEEKKNKAAETFMDIYISLVIAAPMILMILLMMMNMIGFGSMSTSTITVIMVVAVAVINVVFLGFLQLKR
jgi:Flp pilus assembly protein TadB